MKKLTVDELLAALQEFKAANPDKGHLPVGTMITWEAYGFLPVERCHLEVARLNWDDGEKSEYVSLI